MLSEYITSLADVSFHIVAYMYARFRYSGKIRCGLRFFGVFLCGFAVFGPPLRPPLLGLFEPFKPRNTQDLKRFFWLEVPTVI